mmetsp:Transcript_94606/g.138128  ORF Transcript_94606/g.138128 Transcript_94606/m.138128 type:complete len:128 (-) Transcript_94606:27-410(-)
MRSTSSFEEASFGCGCWLYTLPFLRLQLVTLRRKELFELSAQLMASSLAAASAKTGSTWIERRVAGALLAAMLVSLDGPSLIQQIFDRLMFPESWAIMHQLRTSRPFRSVWKFRSVSTAASAVDGRQ